MTHELGRRIDMDYLRVQAAREHVHDQLSLVEPQQTVVNKYAGQLIADGAMDECRGNGRIDFGEAQDDLLVTDLLANACDRFLDVIAHHPVAGACADVADESLEHRPALQRVRHFGVKLTA